MFYVIIYRAALRGGEKLRPSQERSSQSSLSNRHILGSAKRLGEGETCREMAGHVEKRHLKLPDVDKLLLEGCVLWKWDEVNRNMCSYTVSMFVSTSYVCRSSYIH